MRLIAVLLCIAFTVTIAVDNSVNPFLNKQLYVNPQYVAEVQATINANPTISSKLKPYQQISTAYWIDNMAKISTVGPILENAMLQQEASGKDTIFEHQRYDLPNRDCAALASNGEILCADSACTAGLATYEHSYIDPIVQVFSQYPDLTIVALIEPDSLPNLATNLAIAKCTQAQTAYTTGVAYAIKQLATLTNVYQYLDAAHGGWLGWQTNLDAIAPIFSNVLSAAGGQNLIRGFATNTANYQPLGSTSSTSDPCNLKSQSNNAINEVAYINLLNQRLIQAGITNKGYITDTARNGIGNMRSDCSNWCNIKGSAFGILPTTDTSSSGLSIIDAYAWLKTPGESDGTSNSSATRYDAHCGSADSFIPAPEAGNWFPQFFIMLSNNGVPITDAATVGTISVVTVNTATTVTASSGTGGASTAGGAGASSAANSQGSSTATQANTGQTVTSNTGNNNNGASSSNPNNGASSAAADGSATTVASTGEECPVGAEGCACTNGGACNTDLTCASHLCVNLGDKLNSGALHSPSVLLLAVSVFSLLLAFH